MPRRRRWLPAPALAAALLAGCFLVLAAKASAVTGVQPSDCPLAGTTFQGGDGDQAAETGPAACNTQLTDWQSIAQAVADASQVSTDKDALGLDDDIFTTGSKEHTPNTWRFGDQNGGSNPAKSNLLAAWSRPDFATNSVYLNLAFLREVGDQSTVAMHFELNKVSTTWTNDGGTANNTNDDETIPCRTDGDLLVVYEIHPGGQQTGSVVDIIVYEWNGQNGPTSCPDGKDGVTGNGYVDGFKEIATTTANAQGAMNFDDSNQPNGNTTIANYLDVDGDGVLPDGPGGENDPDTFDEGSFGEASLNLTAILGLPASTDVCSLPFAQIQMHSRSSSQEGFKSQMDDFIAPRALGPGCSASGTKYNDVDGNGSRGQNEPGLEGWTIFADVDDNGFPSQLEPSTTTDANGNWTLTNLPSGTYRILEVQQFPWTCTDPNPCEHQVTISPSGGSAGPLAFGNHSSTQIIIRKETEPDGASGIFDFDPSSNLSPDNFQLGDGGTKVYSGVQPNSPQFCEDIARPVEVRSQALCDPYVVTEGQTPGYTLTSVTCDDQDSTGSVEQRSATIIVDFGETVTCTFTNRRDDPPQQQQQQEEPPPEQQVQGEQVSPGSARLAGRTGCQARAFNVRVAGRQIERVVFSIDGRRVRTLRRPNSGDRYVLRVNPRRFRAGPHRVAARVTFTAASQTPPRTLRLRFERCVRRAAPQFTG